MFITRKMVLKDFAVNRKKATKKYGKHELPQIDYSSDALSYNIKTVLATYLQAGSMAYAQLKLHSEAAISLWEPTKRIFKIDPTVSAELCNSAVSARVPVDIIRLPDWSIRVDCPEMQLMACKLRVHANGDIEDMLVIVIDEEKEQVAKALRLNEPWCADEDTEEAKAYIGKALSLLLYLSTVHNSVPRSAYKKYTALSKKNQTKPFIYPEKASIVKIGEELGKMLQTAYTKQAGYSMKAHIRRAHWHNYWTGPKDNRKLICKWTNSTGVNMNLADV
jgi:hypothetical protein